MSWYFYVSVLKIIELNNTVDLIIVFSKLFIQFKVTWVWVGVRFFIDIKWYRDFPEKFYFKSCDSLHVESRLWIIFYDFVSDVLETKNFHSKKLPHHWPHFFPYKTLVNHKRMCKAIRWHDSLFTLNNHQILKPKRNEMKKRILNITKNLICFQPNTILFKH